MSIKIQQDLRVSGPFSMIHPRRSYQPAAGPMRPRNVLGDVGFQMLSGNRAFRPHESADSAFAVILSDAPNPVFGLFFNLFAFILVHFLQTPGKV